LAPFLTNSSLEGQQATFGDVTATTILPGITARGMAKSKAIRQPHGNGVGCLYRVATDTNSVQRDTAAIPSRHQ